MSYTPFTGFSYATGLAALGQGINSWKEGVEKQQDRELLRQALSANPEVATLAALGQPALAAQFYKTAADKEKLGLTQAANRRGLAELGSALGGSDMGGGGGLSLEGLGTSSPGGGSTVSAPRSSATGAPRMPEGWKPSTATPEGVTPDEDLAIRMTIAEASGEGPAGWRAVAGVMANRAKGAGQSLSQVVTAPNQFEPWASRRGELQGYDPNGNKYKIVANAILPVLRGQEEDPTGGATHFYAPKAQRGLGRRPPSWDDGSGEDIGNHRFFRLGYNASGPHGIPQGGRQVQVADAGGSPVIAQSAGAPAVGQPSGDAPQFGSWTQERLSEALRTAPDTPVDRLVGAKEMDDFRPFLTGPDGNALTARQLAQRLQGGGLPSQATQGAPGTLSASGGDPGGGQMPPAARQTLATLGANPAAVDAQRVATEGGPRRVLSGQYPLTSAASPGGAPPGLSRTGAAPAGGIPAAGTPEEVAAAERASGMVYTDGSYPAGLLPPAPGQVAQGGNAPPPAAPPQGAGEALPYRNPNGGQPMPIQGGSGPAVSNAPANLPAPVGSPGGRGPAPVQAYAVPQQTRDSMANLDIGKLTKITANAEYPEALRETAKTFLAAKLADAKMPDDVKTFMWARANGETKARNYDEWKKLQRSENDPAAKISSEAAAREAEATRLGMDPKSPEGLRYILTGQVAGARDTPLTAADKKALFTAEDEIPSLDQTLETLGRAKELNGQTYTGYTAGIRGKLGTALPDRLVPDVIADPRTAGATREFGQIMSMEAIQSMASTLKGATTDREMANFTNLLADPTTPPEIRGRTIDRMIKLAERQKDVAVKRVQSLRDGDYFKPGGGSSGSNRSVNALAPQGAGPGGGQGGKPPAAARFDELMGSGLSKADAYAKMAQEGY